MSAIYFNLDQSKILLSGNGLKKKKNKNFIKNYKCKKGVIILALTVISLVCTYSPFYSEHIF